MHMLYLIQLFENFSVFGIEITIKKINKFSVIKNLQTIFLNNHLSSFRQFLRFHFQKVSFFRDFSWGSGHTSFFLREEGAIEHICIFLILLFDQFHVYGPLIGSGIETYVLEYLVVKQTLRFYLSFHFLQKILIKWPVKNCEKSERHR